MEIMSVSVSVQSGSSYSLPPEAQKAGLEKRINAAELKLERLDKEDALEKSKLDREIKKYKDQLEKIELKKEDEKRPENNKTEEEKEADKKRRFDSFECETCKNRRYQDDSNNSGVSFQTPTKVAPSAADAAVRAHENEHVVRNRNKAERNGMKIVSQSVTIQKAICPDCGRLYTAGGLTRTLMRTDNSDNRFAVGMFGNNKGGFFDTVA